MKGVHEEEGKSDIENWQTNPGVQSKYSICNDKEGAIESVVVIDEPKVRVMTEEEERTSRIFNNRVIVCLLAVSLLWMTSLQIAIGIMDAYVSAPSMSSVIAGCDHSYHTVQDQRTVFGECVARQLIACNTELTTAYIEEKARVAANEADNAATLLVLQRRLELLNRTVRL